MNKVVELVPAEIMPDRETVLDNQGIGENVNAPEEVDKIADEAKKLFASVARPVGMISEISKPEFERVLNSGSDNEEGCIAARIYPQAENLALFALTVGGEISAKIEGLFELNDFALGSMLDALASQAAEKAAERFEEHYRGELAGRSATAPGIDVLAYSPGYCGWHISNQRGLFRVLQPERIGISLNESCLMNPLKSVSGVLVAGKREIHTFTPEFDFCGNCRERSCLERMNRLQTA